MLGALLVGSGDRGYTLRSWRPEVAEVAGGLARLSDEPVVLVQSGLFPHAGYADHVRLLTRETLADPVNAGAAVLVAADVNAYPFKTWEVEEFTNLSPIAPMPHGLVAVRLKHDDGSPGFLAARHRSSLMTVYAQLYLRLALLAGDHRRKRQLRRVTACALVATFDHRLVYLLEVPITVTRR